METVLEECTTAEQRPFFVSEGQKGSMQRIFVKKCFLFTMRSVCCIKRFRTGSINSLKHLRNSQTMLDHMRKWLRRQSKDFYAAGFDAQVKRWDKCINVGGGYAAK
jgi:hypothetical protein